MQLTPEDIYTKTTKKIITTNVMTLPKNVGEGGMEHGGNELHEKQVLGSGENGDNAKTLSNEKLMGDAKEGEWDDNLKLNTGLKEGEREAVGENNRYQKNETNVTRTSTVTKVISKLNQDEVPDEEFGELMRKETSGRICCINKVFHGVFKQF
jgi:hypothetical protein